MKTILLVLAILFAIFMGFPRKLEENRAIEVLYNSGYTDISLQGAAPLRCPQGYIYSRYFTAKSARGAEVKGVVCAGYSDKIMIRLL